MAVTLGRLVGTTPSGVVTLPKDAFPIGPYYGIFRTITFDSAYTSGGEELTATTLEFNKVYGVFILGSNSSAVQTSYDIVNQKLIVSPAKLTSYSTITALELLDLTGYVVTVLVIGT